MPSDETFKNIDYKNKAVAVPLPDRINDIDTKNTLYSNIIDAAENKSRGFIKNCLQIA